MGLGKGFVGFVECGLRDRVPQDLIGLVFLFFNRIGLFRAFWGIFWDWYRQGCV